MFLESSIREVGTGGPEGLEASIARADRLAAANRRTGDLDQLAEAISAYRHALALGATGWTRAGIEHNLGTAMCLVGQQETAPVEAAAAFELARRHFEAALALRSRAVAPRAWALTQANLAIVHLCVYRLTGSPVEAMAGHIALDSAREVFRQADDWPLMDWIASIRAHLLRASDRRRLTS